MTERRHGNKDVPYARKVLPEAGMVRKAGWQRPQMSVAGVSDWADGTVSSCKISC